LRKDNEVPANISIDYALSSVLEKLGFNVNDEDDSYLDLLLERFPKKLPTTYEFSKFSRQLSKSAEPSQDADGCLMVWMKMEEHLFKVYEKHLVQIKLNEGFESVNEFIKFSLSVQNRRKSRAGYALENHLRELFNQLEVRYSYNAVTENNSKPDFIFPDIINYLSPNFNDTYLDMLGVKTSCKDRWRQVLSEAKRVKHKHLLTLEPAISINQTNEMKNNYLKLVVPSEILSTFTTVQQKDIFSVSNFIDYIKSKQ